MMTAANNFRVFFDRDVTIKLRIGINTGESKEKEELFHAKQHKLISQLRR